MPLHRDLARDDLTAGRLLVYLAAALVISVLVLSALGGVLLHTPAAHAASPRAARTLTAALVTRRPPERPADPAPAVKPRALPAEQHPAPHLRSEAPVQHAPIAALSRDPSKGQRGDLDDALAKDNDVEQGPPPASAPIAVTPAPVAPPAPAPLPPPPPPSPTAAYALDPPHLHLPDELQSEAQDTSMLVQFAVHADGAVATQRLSSTGFDDVDAYVMTSVRGWRFHPATIGGRPVESTLTIKIDFEQ